MFAFISKYHLISLRSVFLPFLCFSTAASPAQCAAFKCYYSYNQYNKEQKANHIQTVVLKPVEVMGSRSQMIGPLVSHNKLCPVHREIQGLHGTVIVYGRQLLHFLLIATGDSKRDALRL